MNRQDEIAGLRLLAGEASADERRAFAERLEREPDLRAAFERRRAAWAGLELPAAAAPPGFTTRVMARARAESSLREAQFLPVGWRRAVAALALMAGVAAGAGLGALDDAAVPPESGLEVWEDESLAAAYLDAFDLATAGTLDGNDAGAGTP